MFKLAPDPATPLAAAAAIAARHNARYAIGDGVIHIHAQGADPVWDHLTSEAFVLEGQAMVYIDGLLNPVPVAEIYAPPMDLSPPPPIDRGSWMDTPVWGLALAFVTGFACAVLLALSTAPAHSTPPEHISIGADCDMAPPDAPAGTPADVPAALEPRSAA